MAILTEHAERIVDVVQYLSDEDGRAFLKPDQLVVGGSFYARRVLHPRRGGPRAEPAILPRQVKKYAADVLLRLDKVQPRRLNGFRLHSTPRIDGAYEVVTTQLDIAGDPIAKPEENLMSPQGIIFDRGRWAPIFGRFYAKLGYFLDGNSSPHAGDLIAVQFGRPNDPTPAEVATKITDFVLPLPQR
jgi:hypothetical protein